jgi:hypothetical protein
MSDKKFEPCSLEEATHFGINRVVHEINDKVYYSFNGTRVGIRLREEDTFIPEDAFFLLGINPLREIKPEPVVFEHIFTFEEISLGIIPDEAEGKKFKCVEILEDDHE